MTDLRSPQECLAILVGGGPAPGINGVVASATIEAINSGLRVIGIRDGFRWLVAGDTSRVVDLEIKDVSRIHFTGGSILRTSRTNPAQNEQSLDRAVRTLTELGVHYLVCIGGDDTTYGAARVAERCQGRIGVATVPKTIDNDLPLPENAPTFGFETARAVGAGIVESLMEDARTTGRWYLAVSMGRTSGALTLGICKSAGATLAVIPEEFGESVGAGIELGAVADTIVGAIIKRRSLNRDHGVVLVAEGIAERLDLSALAALGSDAYGHPPLSDVPIGSILRDYIRETLKELNVAATVVSKDIGYELRCAKPVPFDVEYTRTLGYGAVRNVLGGGARALITITGGRVKPVGLAELKDPQTGRIRVRRVDVATESYQVARSYMIRLELADFEEPQLSHLAAQTNLSPATFRDRFIPVVHTTTPAAHSGLPRRIGG